VKFLAGYLFLIVVGQEIPEDFKLQISDSFRFAVKEYQGNSPNTLFVKIGTEGNDVIAGIFSWSAKERLNYRTDSGTRIRIPVSSWNNIQELKAPPDLEISCHGDQYFVKVKHMSRKRYDEVQSAEGKPLSFPGPKKAVQKAPACQPPANGAAAQIVDAQGVFDAASLGVKKQKKDSYLKTLREDLDWFEAMTSKIMNETDTQELIEDGLKATRAPAGSKASVREFSRAKISEAQQKVLSRLLGEMSKREEFKKDWSRGDRLLVALTLEGEFRRYDEKHKHRSLSHLYWAYESMKNRVRHSRASADWIDRYMTINSDLTQENDNSRNFLRRRLGGIILAADQYSAWNTGDSTLSDILLGTSRSNQRRVMEDIADFVAAADADLVRADLKSRDEIPWITHYVSPGSLPKLVGGAPKYPSHWFAAGFKVLKGSSQFPPVIRDDLPNNKRSLQSFGPDIDQSLIDPLWFEGGIEEFWK